MLAAISVRQLHDPPLGLRSIRALSPPPAAPAGRAGRIRDVPGQAGQLFEGRPAAAV